MHLEFISMSKVDNAEYIALNNNPLVRRQMPLTGDNFGAIHEISELLFLTIMLLQKY